MKKILLLSVMAFICLNRIQAQCCNPFLNPGFEGTLKTDSTPPPDWSRCGPGYEGTFPLATVNTFPACAGATYAAILFSEIGGDTTKGAISQRLNCPLVNYDTLTIALVDLPSSSNQNPDNSVCEIYGAYDSCGTDQLLWSGMIVNSQNPNTGITPIWIQDTFVVHPLASYPYITITVTTQTPADQGQLGFYIGVDSLTIDCYHNPTGIQQINTTNITLYPNPASNTITVNSTDNSPYTLIVYDLTGREIMTKELAGTTNTVDVSQLAKGVYLAKMIQGDKSYCQKLVIQ